MNMLRTAGTLSVKITLLLPEPSFHCHMQTLRHKAEAGITSTFICIHEHAHPPTYVHAHMHVEITPTDVYLEMYSTCLASDIIVHLHMFPLVPFKLELQFWFSL